MEKSEKTNREFVCDVFDWSIIGPSAIEAQFSSDATRAVSLDKAGKVRDGGGGMIGSARPSVCAFRDRRKMAMRQVLR
jgi:hypothetical protein